MTIKITGPQHLTLPSGMGGDDEVYALVLVCVSRGLVVEEACDGSGDAVIRGITDTSLLTVPVVQMLVGKGAEVHDYPAYFEINNLSDPSPFSETNEEWSDWGISGANHHPIQVDSKWYRSAAVGESGEKLLASVWVPEILNGLVVLSDVQFREARDAAEVPPE